MIEHFQLPEVIMLEPIWKKLQDEQEDYVTQKARVDFISSQIQEKRNATTVLKQEINTTEVLIQQIKENDKDDISSQYEQSKIELEQLQEQLNKLWNENKSNHYKQIFLNVS